MQRFVHGVSRGKSTAEGRPIFDLCESFFSSCPSLACWLVIQARNHNTEAWFFVTMKPQVFRAWILHFPATKLAIGSMHSYTARLFEVTVPWFCMGILLKIGQSVTMAFNCNSASGRMRVFTTTHALLADKEGP